MFSKNEKYSNGVTIGLFEKNKKIAKKYGKRHKIIRQSLPNYHIAAFCLSECFPRQPKAMAFTNVSRSTKVFINVYHREVTLAVVEYYSEIASFRRCNHYRHPSSFGSTPAH